MIHRLKKIYEKRPFLSAALLGAASALGFAPIYVIPFLFVAFSCLFIALVNEGGSYRETFLKVWTFFTAHLVVGLYWIALSMHVDWARFGWLFPFAAVGLPAFIALFYGIGGIIFRYLNQGTRDFSSLLLCTLCFSGIEYVRGHVLTGFSWLMMSDCWLLTETIPQFLSIFGAYGLSFWTFFLAFLPGFMSLLYGSKRGIITSLVLIGSVLGMSHYYWDRILSKTTTSFHAGFELVLVQPNIPQTIKWNPNLYSEHLNQLMRLTYMAQSQDKKIFIWPEASSPYVVEGEGAYTRELGKVLKPNDLLLIGAPRYSYGSYGQKNMHNSLLAINNHGKLVAEYDKVHLVPFGEYLPGRAMLPAGITTIANGATDFVPGVGLRTLKIEGLPSFAPLICYEIIFPGEVIDQSRRPEWLLNLTNDGWYLNSSGPYQHFAMTRARAIEEGLPVVRVANTGISAVIDGKGRVLKKLGYNHKGLITMPLPRPLEPTPFSLYRDWIYFAFVAIFAMVALSIRMYKRVKPCQSLKKIN